MLKPRIDASSAPGSASAREPFISSIENVLSTLSRSPALMRRPRKLRMSSELCRNVGARTSDVELTWRHSIVWATPTAAPVVLPACRCVSAMTREAPGESTMRACQGSSASFSSRRLHPDGESV
jgi:hypothetical protein